MPPRAIGADGELAGELAFRIVRAADEAAEPAELEPDPAVLAVRALARIGAVGLRRKQMRRQHLVERVDHLRDAQLLDVVDRADEVLPEVAQHVLVGQLVVGNLVELLFEAGGEIVFDVAGEEVFQERDQHAALVLGDEPLLVEPHIAAVAQHLQDRGVGRGPADAELFHALDQRGFGVARRRLGEMLGRGNLALLQRLAGRHLRQAVGVLVVGLVVLVLGVEREEAVELHHRAGGAQIDGAGARLGGDVHRGALELGGFHLACDGAQPDQLVEPGLVVVEHLLDVLGTAGEVGRADRLVGLLGVLRLGHVLARRGRHVLLAVVALDDAGGPR